MNTWTLLMIFLGTVHLAGFVALVWSAKWAPEGYEDADGFHVGSRSEPVLRGDPAEIDLDGEWKQAA